MSNKGPKCKNEELIASQNAVPFPESRETRWGRKITNKKWHNANKHKGTIPWLSHCQSGSTAQDSKEKCLPASCHSSQGCSPDLYSLYRSNASGTKDPSAEPAG